MKKPQKQGAWFSSTHLVWGWYPASPAGWVSLILYICLLIYGSWVLLPHSTSDFDANKVFYWLIFVVATVCSLVALVWSTGGKPPKDNSKK
ncbi:MAG: hypothetical protein PVI21_03145 [Candidatus Woesebacteria bacterium]|jgi:hypothetical protein